MNDQESLFDLRCISMALMPARMVLAIIGISLAVVLASCGGTSYEQEIALEAHWQCDVHHRTYSDLNEMEAALDSRLASEGISADRYAEFKAAMEASPDLRSETLAAYEAYCGLASDD